MRGLSLTILLMLALVACGLATGTADEHQVELWWDYFDCHQHGGAWVNDRPMNSTTIMIHNATGIHAGDAWSMKNDIEQFQRLENLYIDALVKHSNLSKAQMKKILSDRIDHYCNAEMALKYGLADRIA